MVTAAGSSPGGFFVFSLGCQFWCQVATCFEAPFRGVMNGGSGVSIGGVRIVRVGWIFYVTDSRDPWDENQEIKFHHGCW